MDQTPNLSLPFILPSQAQKHITHNEALEILDAVVQLSVESAIVTTPPTTPAAGIRYIVPAGATGDWADEENSVAMFDGIWRFVPAVEGMVAWIRDAGALHVFADGAWTQLDGTPPGQMSLAALGLNAPADLDNPLTVHADTVLLSHDGSDHRLKLNKAASADTGSLLFQTGFSGRAEMGLPGSDSFKIKVSSDGSVWKTALSVAAATGLASFPNGQRAAGQMRRIEAVSLGTAFTTTSATPQATGLSVTLTPADDTSKFLVRASLMLGADFWYTTPAVGIFRNGTKVWPVSSPVLLRHQLLADTIANSKLVSLSAPIEFLDAPATAAAVTYEVRLASTSAGYNAHLNRRENDTTVRGESNLIVTEIWG